MPLRLKTSLLIFAMLLLFTNPLWAGEKQQAELLKPVKLLFDGMREGDGNKVRAAFSVNAVMVRAHAQFREGGTPEQFAQAVEKPKQQIWDEKIWDIKIQRDDKLASVWTQFAFYLGDKLKHCGVNAFQLYQFDDGWKIIYLADTYRNEGCVVPENFE